MTISRRVWDEYIAGLRKVSVTATNRFKAFLTAHEPITNENINLVLEYAYALATKYGEATGALACQMYDATARASGVVVDAAAPAATATMAEVAKAVNGTLKTGNNDIVADAVGRLVKMAGVDTTMQNAIRDGAEWAWIPRGETCAFCIALASRGWQEASRAAMKGNHAEHIHANCDCTYQIRFDSRLDVEGYDPDRYLEMYYYKLDANGNPIVGEDGKYIKRGTSTTARLDGMRRDFYAMSKARAERQGLSEDAKRIVLNSSEAEEVRV